MVKHRMMKLRD